MQEEGQAINIFRFVINPNDFAQSVENIFYLSFLIRDGKVAFETDAGEPVICTHAPTFLDRGMTESGCQICANNPPISIMLVA